MWKLLNDMKQAKGQASPAALPSNGVNMYSSDYFPIQWQLQCLQPDSLKMLATLINQNLLLLPLLLGNSQPVFEGTWVIWGSIGTMSQIGKGSQKAKQKMDQVLEDSKYEDTIKKAEWIWKIAELDTREIKEEDCFLNTGCTIFWKELMLGKEEEKRKQHKAWEDLTLSPQQDVCSTRAFLPPPARSRL